MTSDNISLYDAIQVTEVSLIEEVVIIQFGLYSKLICFHCTAFSYGGGNVGKNCFCFFYM